MEIGKFEDIRSYEPNTNEYAILLDYDELCRISNNSMSLADLQIMIKSFLDKDTND